MGDGIPILFLLGEYYCMKKLYYLVHLDVENTCFKKRNISPAAQTKATYILKSLNQIGYSVNVISPLCPLNMECDKGGTAKAGENFITFFRYFGNKNIFKRILSFLSRKIGLILYFLKNIRKNDTVLVYHSLEFLRTLYFLKKFLKFKLILEVEEIYADVIGEEKCKKRELKFFKLADAYLFSAKPLEGKINTEKKPHIFIYGTYDVAPKMQTLFNDEKTHIVYAGTLDPRKGGAIAAVESAEFLSEQYHLHILGFGSDTDTEKVIIKINEISSKSKATITYDGCLSGEEYISFIQSCDIGLSTQNPDAEFNGTSFPSKILSYMSNGLQVVSIRIPAIETSDVGEYIYYYDIQTPEKIAKAIHSVDLNSDFNPKSLISQLDDEFKKNVYEVLDNAKS